MSFKRIQLEDKIANYVRRKYVNNTCVVIYS